jgi:hypothetical protein
MFHIIRVQESVRGNIFCTEDQSGTIAYFRVVHSYFHFERFGHPNAFFFSSEKPELQCKEKIIHMARFLESLDSSGKIMVRLGPLPAHVSLNSLGQNKANKKHDNLLNYAKSDFRATFPKPHTVF